MNGTVTTYRYTTGTPLPDTTLVRSVRRRRGSGFGGVAERESGGGVSVLWDRRFGDGLFLDRRFDDLYGHRSGRSRTGRCEGEAARRGRGLRGFARPVDAGRDDRDANLAVEIVVEGAAPDDVRVGIDQLADVVRGLVDFHQIGRASCRERCGQYV